MNKIHIIIINCFCFLLLPLFVSANFQAFPDLEYGMTNPSVSTLQKFLNENGYIVNQTQQEEGSIGFEGNYFGKLTRQALSLFQKNNNLQPAEGYFGTITKNKIDSLVIIPPASRNEILSSDEEYSDLEVEVIDRMGKTDVQAVKPADPKTTGKKQTKKSTPAWLSTKWIRYVDGKYYDVLYSNTYTRGTYVTYTVTDWDSMNKKGFFLGWFGPSGVIPGAGEYKSEKLSFYLWDNVEIHTKYQNCAKLSPDHVFFSSIDQLENKLVVFAQNKSDKNLQINAKGEVLAFAVQYTDDSLCAKFIDIPTGGGSIDIQTVTTFFDLYKDKTIKKMFQYHTHDLKSMKKISQNISLVNILINKNGNYFSPIPSNIDLLGSALVKINQYHKILGLGDVIERVVSSDRTVYEYDLSATKKAKNILGSQDRLIKFEIKSIETALQAAENSKNVASRVEFTNKDSIAAQQALLTFYQNELGATFSTYQIK